MFNDIIIGDRCMIEYEVKHIQNYMMNSVYFGK